MADESDTQPTEHTPKGLEVPVPERGEFFDNLKKIAKPKDEDSTTGGAEQQ